MEIQRQIKKWQIDKMCPRCERSVLIFTGRISIGKGYVHSYHHLCEDMECNQEEWFDKHYPYTEERVE